MSTDLEGKWGMRIESALVVRKMKVSDRSPHFFPFRRVLRPVCADADGDLFHSDEGPVRPDYAPERNLAGL